MIFPTSPGGIPVSFLEGIYWGRDNLVIISIY